jgi:hypothetical protein
VIIFCEQAVLRDHPRPKNSLLRWLCSPSVRLRLRGYCFEQKVMIGDQTELVDTYKFCEKMGVSFPFKKRSEK